MTLTRNPILWTRAPATVWTSKDFVNWVLVPMNWPATPHYWAPDVIRRPNGRYYLFYNQPCNTFAGVSDTPIGPWTPLTPGDGLVIRDRLVKDVITLDTQLFEDKDGTLYGYWGTWGIFPNSGCGFGVFNPDMKSFSRLGMIPNTQAKDFFEAPFMIERNGVYYFTYSSGSCHDATYRVQYAVSDKPDGEFKMGPNNPILASTADGKVHGPGHHSILRRGDDFFIVYHRHDIPVTPNGMHRQICADRLVFGTDGMIEKVTPKDLALAPPEADVLVHVDSAKLDYGPLKSWANNGAIGGAFSSGDKPPTVEDLNGRIAVRFEPGQSLEWSPGVEVPLANFTLMASVANPSLEAGEGVVEVEGADGNRGDLLRASPVGDWQELALVYRGGRGTLFLDGKPALRMAPTAPHTAKVIRLGGKTLFSGMLARLQLFRRALSDEELLQWSAMAKQERMAPAPSPAAFAPAEAATTRCSHPPTVSSPR